MLQIVPVPARRGRGRPRKVRPQDPCALVAPLSLPNLPPAITAEADLAIEAAFAKTYLTDPLFGDDLTALRGPLDSVLKRHGVLIEKTLAWALSLNGHLDVMTQVAVPVTEVALDLCRANQPAATKDLSLPVTGAVAKTAIVDIVVHDKRANRLILASVKRGGGIQGGTVFRQDRLELRAAGLALKSMLTAQGLNIASVETVTVDWLGRSGVIAGKIVRGADLDAFFGVDVQGYIVAMTRHLAEGVRVRAMASVRAFVEATTTTAPSDLNGVPAPLDVPAPIAEAATPRTDAKAGLAACCDELPRRRQGRQMRVVNAG